MKNVTLLFIFILCLCLGNDSFASTEPCSIDSIKLILNCEGKTKSIQLDGDYFPERFHSYKSNDLYYLIFGTIRGVIVDGMNVFTSSFPDNFYTTALIALDKSFKKKAATEFTQNAMTIPGGVKDMPFTMLEFGDYFAVLNYFEKHGGTITIFRKSNLERVKDLDTQSPWALSDKDFSVV